MHDTTKTTAATRRFRCVAAVAVLIGLSSACAGHPSAASTEASLSVPSVAAMPKQAVPPPTPSPTPTIRVPLAAPTHISIPGVHIDADVEEYTDAQVKAAGGVVNPVHRDTVAWWSGGGTPGDPADNTVYLYGHVARTTAVFNPLASVQVGQTITVTTAAGTLTYAVTAILPPILKKDLPTDPDVTASVPGRLVLIGCHRDPDQGTRPTTKNTVVIAQQVAG